MSMYIIIITYLAYLAAMCSKFYGILYLDSAVHNQCVYFITVKLVILTGIKFNDL